MIGKQLRSLLLFLFIFQLIFSQSSDSQFNCFSILVGKNASLDGSVLFAHNEDDSGINLVNWYKVPRIQYDKNNVDLFAGGELEQAEETNEYLWLEMPGMHFSDSYMNEYGVTIGSNACRSKEDSAKLVNGGIGYNLRKIMAERVKSAKEAIKIAGSIVDSIGYSSSGRTYCISDPNEAWMMSIVKGKHWVAQRVPDDHIAIIPNYYTIQEINLADTCNFLGSADIIEYAIERGWYNPDSDDKFNFRLAYGKPSSINSIVNIGRNWGATNLLSSIQYDFSDEFLFSFKPKKPVSVKDLMNVLRYHYENTELEDKTIPTPHNYKTLPICRKDTQYGMVAQLRSWLPSDIGNIMWLAPYRPCSQVFIPWYYGISKIPDNFTVGDYNTALKNHFIEYDDIKTETRTHNFWSYVEFADRINANYYELMPSVIDKKEATQNDISTIFDEFDTNLEKRYKRKKSKTIKNINFFMKDMIEISLDYLK